MATLFDFDKITKLPSENVEEIESYQQSANNRLRRFKTYEDYFHDMDISDEKKGNRIRLAEKLEDLMLSFFIFCEMQRIVGATNIKSQEEFLYERYTKIVFEMHGEKDLSKYGLPEDYIDFYARKRAEEIVSSTNKNLNEIESRRNNENNIYDGKESKTKSTDDWWLSDDRAFVLGAEDSEAIENFEDLADALDSGFTMKRWVDMKDNRERGTHKEVGGTVIPITDPFIVGGDYMMFPKDLTYSPSPDEVANCRCYVTYL